MRRMLRILCLFFMAFFSLGISVFAEEREIYPEEQVPMEAITYVNPLYEGLDFEVTSDSGHSFYEEFEPEYMESLDEVHDFLRDAMEARVTNVTVYYKSTEWVMADSGWVSNWLKQIYKETANATEGDYLKLHVHRVRFCGGSASLINGVYYYPLPFEFTYLSTADQEDAVTEKVDHLMNSFAFTEDTKDIIKIRTIYDWICENVRYDNDHDENYTLKHTAYAAIVDGQSVCQGYASLMYRLFREAGLETRAITGKSNDVGHAWNIVKYGDYYYNLDSTWDAGSNVYRYYMKCDANFGNHTRGEDYSASSFYAKYPMTDADLQDYTISYNPNGGMIHITEQSKEPGKSVKLISEIPEKECTLTYVSNGGEAIEPRKTKSTFLEWNTDIHGKGDSYLPEDIYDIDKDLQLYAQWKDELVGKLPEITRSGYIFKGWYTELNSGEFVDEETLVTKDCTVFARWEREGDPQDVSTLTIASIKDVIYTGDALEPEVSVYEGDYELIKDKDYTVSYKNNVDAGIGEVVICGQGDYCGEITKTFNIAKAKQQMVVDIPSKIIETGNKEQITVQGLGEITFLSSDPSIGKVDANGYVTGVKAGKIDITVQASGDKNYQKATVVLTIEIQQAVHDYDVVEAFVARLYVECLNREPDETGLADWTNRLKSKELTGISAAGGIVFSQEFKNKNLCNEDYVELLYRAFMGRTYDTEGKAYWMERLSAGATREDVFNGFALSAEFEDICSNYAIAQGNGIPIPTYGTVPMGSCSLCGREDGVTAFVKRMYEICLERPAEKAGLDDWTSQLWNHTASGKDVGYGFIFSREYVEKQTSDDTFVECLYNTFMGRDSDPIGKMDWMNRLKNGVTRKEVFEGFVYSNEFTHICYQYGILRD